MDFKQLEKSGRESYKALIGCVRIALQEEQSEYAVICGVALLRLADAEKANYFGATEAVPYDYNTAMGLTKDIIKLADKQGVPHWLDDELKQIKKIQEDWN